jgi:hypothetical protein
MCNIQGGVGMEEHEGMEPEVNEVEDRAKLLGWQPEGEFKGDPSRHTTAEEWVERSETLVPIMKATNRKLEEDLKAALKKTDDMTTQFEESKQTTEKILKMQEMAQERAYEQALDSIKKEQIQAFESQDLGKFQELEVKKDKLEKPVIEPTPTQEATKKEEATLTPAAQEFLDNNEWFKTDPNMQQQAMLFENQMAQTNPSEKFTEGFYKKLTDKMALIYPDHEAFKKEEVAGGVDSGGSFRSAGSSSSSGKKGFSQLPKDAQAQCRKQVEQGLFKDADEYCSLYPWD